MPMVILLQSSDKDQLQLKIVVPFAVENALFGK